MYNKNSEKVELKISYSKLLKKENVNSEQVFLIYLDKGSLDCIITALFPRKGKNFKWILIENIYSLFWKIF